MFNCCSPPTFPFLPLPAPARSRGSKEPPCCCEPLLGAALGSQVLWSPAEQEDSALTMGPETPRLEDRQESGVHDWAGDPFNLSGDLLLPLTLCGSSGRCEPGLAVGGQLPFRLL